jgi:SAM-dependent methyltransferase
LKRHLREHPLSRDAYRLAARSWHHLRVAAIERVAGRYYTEARLDRMFAAQADPWNYAGDPASEQRRRLTLQALPRPRYPRMLEVGCAEGWVTERLAARADELVCVDISTVALQRAQHRCAGLSHVRFVQADVATALPPGPFDAIVCGGVLVLLPAPALEPVRDRLVAALRPGGDLLIENLTEGSPGELAGRWVGERFLAHPALSALSHQHVDDYDITVLRRS